MKEKILKLRSKGYSYRQIEKKIGCSKSTIAYHCNKTTKNKVIEKTRKYREENKKDKIKSGAVTKKARSFCQRRVGNKLDTNLSVTFTYRDVVKKFGEDTTCYLTGSPVNLRYDNYHFDHIIPRAKGGSNTIENLGICIPEANAAKGSLIQEDFFELISTILIHNGYTVTKN